MTKEELISYNQFMEEYYPYLEPCCECEYWRYITEGKASQYFNRTDKLSRNVANSMRVPCCHYALDNDCATDEHTGPFWEGMGNCKHFTTRKGKRKRKRKRKKA